MPYIKYLERYGCQPIMHLTAENAGQLNFQVTSLIKDYLAYHKLSYQTINDIVGALEGAKLEFVRRVVNPYEDKKIKENGDLYVDPV